MQNEKRDERELVVAPSDRVVLEDLLVYAEDIQSKCSDFNVTRANTSNMRFNSDSGRLVYREDLQELRQAPMSKYAMSQLCTKIGVPPRYIDKCITDGRIELAGDNINSWLSDYNRNLFIREHDGRIRGILSDRYSVLDTPDILRVLGDVIDSSEYSVKGYHISPERFHARIVQDEMLNVAGEDLFAGIQVDSSDVGRSTLIVRFLVFKLVCINGLIVSRGGGVLFQQRHVGIERDEFYANFVKSLSLFPEYKEFTINQIEQARSKGLKYDFSSEDGREEFAVKVKHDTSMSNESVGKLIDVMLEKYSPTRWGMINALTEVAQDFTLERRIELEKIAGDLLLAS